MSKSGKLLVTGATGGLGGAAIQALLKRIPSSDIVALARDPQKLDHLASQGVEVRQGDYLDIDSLRQAFAAIDRILMVSAPAFSDGLVQHANVIEAARAAHVQHVIYTAIQHQDPPLFEVPMAGPWDRDAEGRLHASGLRWTILRNPLYLDSLPAMLGRDILANGIRVPGGHRGAALASRNDLAEAAAVVLSSGGHAGKVYTLSNKHAVTLREIAAFISEGSGCQVPYTDVPATDYVAERIAEGFPEPVASFLAAWFQAIAAGEFSELTGHLEQLLGRPPQSARDFLTEVYRHDRP